MKNKFQLFFLIALVSLTAFGCGKKADTNKSIEDIQKEVASMSTADLEKTAQAYVKAISDQRAELEKVKAELKTLSPKDLLGEKAQKIKTEMADVTTEMSELAKRYNIYASKFREMGGDVSKIKLN
ncbi:MAG: hypothetical protein H6757_02720 [Candidatus Omnitrophica bacterium]|nr:hypothetical protein [Candidatus Omnitrophota bacterium]